MIQTDKTSEKVFETIQDYKNKSNNTPEKRLSIYIDVINNYLKYTNLKIYITESSGYGFPEFKGNPRVKIYSFIPTEKIECKKCVSTPYEAISILKAYMNLKLNTYKKIIKITGRYFIPNIEQMIINIPNDSDIFFQHYVDHELHKQFSEYFGCKTIYLESIMNKILENTKYNMMIESTLYTYLSNKNYKIYRFPPVKLLSSVNRGGDDLSMEYL
jgi:hypothetical protein